LSGKTVDVQADGTLGILDIDFISPEARA